MGLEFAPATPRNENRNSLWGPGRARRHMTCADEATVEEMREAFDDFLSACGYNTQGYDDNKTLQEFDAEAISDNITKTYTTDLMSVFDEKM